MRGDILHLDISTISEAHAPLRMYKPDAVARITASMRRIGQIAPIVVVVRNTADSANTHDLIDGFKRLHAARALDDVKKLKAHVLEVDTRAAKAAMLQINWAQGGIDAFEEALVAQSLCTADGLSQLEVGILLDRTQCWVSRRISLVERLDKELQEELRLGILRPTQARDLARMPRSMQVDVAKACREHGLGCRDLARFVDTLLGVPAEERAKLLASPLDTLNPKASNEGADARLGQMARLYQGALRQMTSGCRSILQIGSKEQVGALTPIEKGILATDVKKARKSAAAAIQRLISHEDK
jgi:ParB-like chromosome segregation protein Spo0J